MAKMCIDDDLKDVVGGLHTPVDDNDQISENDSVQENDETTSDETD